MDFSEKLIDLRRREGWSQERLAEELGVTRQSVSKWEMGTAMPELGKLISLSDLFGVTVDYLVKDGAAMEHPSSSDDMGRLEEKVDNLTRYVRGTVYAYDSKTHIFGIPLVSVRIGFVRGRRMVKEDVARGIIAIGNAAVGVVALGIISVGLVSFGVIALGLLLALGITATGPAAFGVVALGYLALGVSAVGVYAGGVCAAGADLAVGVAAASIHTAVGYDADAANVLLWGDGLTYAEVEAFLLAHCPGLRPPLLRIFSFLGSIIK